MVIRFFEIACNITFIRIPETFLISTQNRPEIALSPSLTGPQSVCKAQAGHVAYLTCTTNMPTNLSLAWIRLRDNHILTVDSETFIQDNRLVK